MTYGKLKQRIYALLDLSSESAVSEGAVIDAVNDALPDAVSSAARKIAATLLCVSRRADVSFSYDGSLICATLPNDFLSLKAVYSGGKRHLASEFETAGGKIYGSCMTVGTADMFYNAYPEDTSEYGDDDELEFDDAHADILAYGAALELCSTAFPGDYRRYVVLATEYDERMANACLYGGRTDRVVNSLYSKRRLV